MSKHLGLLTKVDNTGTKWYRRVLNVGDTAISAGNLVEVAYDAHSTTPLNLTAHYGISSDYNLCRLISGDAAMYNSPVKRVLGVAVGAIQEKGAAAGDVRYYDGWVQYRGAAQVCSREPVTANTLVCVASSTTGFGKGHGACMATADGEDAASGAIGMCLCSTGAGGGYDWTWVYLWLG